jgi:tetratricopeptide (TPR) repeat protein
LIRRCEVPDQLLTDFLLSQMEVCPECREHREVLVAMIDAGEVDPSDLSPFSVGMAYSRRKVAEIWPEIEPLELDWARRRLSREPARWAMVERLAEKSVELAARDPKAALAMADLVLEVAERLPVLLPDEPYPEDMDEVPLDEDTQLEALALGHAVRANAFRVAERYLLAEQEFLKMDRLGVEMPLMGFYGRALSLRASLFADRRDFDRALECLEEAEAALANQGIPPSHDHRLRTRLKRIMILGLKTDLAAALDLSSEALSVHPTDRTDRLTLALVHAHIDNLSRLGLVDEARSYLPTLSRLCKEVGTPEDNLQGTWVRARLDYEDGNLDSALKSFLKVEDGWLQQERTNQWSLVTMETALVYLAMGRPAEVRRLARAALPTLIHLAASPDIFAVFKILADATALDIARVRSLLHRVQALTQSVLPPS